MTSKKIPVLTQLETSFGTTYDKSMSSSGETPLSFGDSEAQQYPLYICITEYTKRMDDELDMKPGDKIEVVTDDGSYNDGWYLGRNLRTQEEGLYPKVFTQEIVLERKPGLMRAKSTKRVGSNITLGSTSNLTLRSQDGSTSELPTPQVLETAKPALYRRMEGVKTENTREIDMPVDRNISVKSTMSDIDKALEELRGDTVSTPVEDLQEESLDETEQTDGTQSLDYNYNNINGIDTNDLDPANAKHWTPEQVTAYLLSIGFDVESASRFQQHKISGAILLELELSHLKEIDINSFGTRFEIFKEIEALKSVAPKIESSKSQKRKSLMPAPSFEQSSRSGVSPRLKHDMPSYRGHLRKTSRSAEELPSDSTPTTRNTVTPSSSKRNTSAQRTRPTSLLFTNETTKPPELNGEVFLSPRRAPKPPSYPSPVQPPKSPIAQSYSSFSNGGLLSPHQQSFKNPHQHPTIYEQVANSKNGTGNSKVGSSDDGNFFEFPKKSVPTSNTPSLPNPYGLKFEDPYKPTSEQSPANRSSVIYSGHRKTKSGGSFVELFNRISMLSNQNDEESNGGDNAPVSDRPTSSVYGHSRAASVGVGHMRGSSHLSTSEKRHRRNSSLLSFMRDSDERTKNDTAGKKSRQNSASHSRRNSFLGQFKTFDIGTPSQRQSMSLSTSPVKDQPASSAKKDGKRRSVSAKESNKEVFYDAKETLEADAQKNRSVSETAKPKNLRSISAKSLGKQKTTAFTEGIRSITVTEAMRNADCSGWMSKKGTGAMGVWKNRFFTLHGTRLSYFSNTTDNRERGLIDITAHRVLPAKEDDKFVALYAASTGKGRYCFKLVPPQPGSKKGLTFTQPRVHYFAVDTNDEMRAWIAALIKATIDIDTSVPIVSSCATPTVSLARAQEMLSLAREETRMMEHERALNEEEEEELYWDHHKTEQTQSSEDFVNMSLPSTNHNTTMTSGLASPYLVTESLTASSTTGTGSISDGIKSHVKGGKQAEYFGLDPKHAQNRV